jgi:hypothetical protein
VILPVAALGTVSIPDERGRQLDVHAMRTAFNTHLAVAGLRTRQPTFSALD